MSTVMSLAAAGIIGAAVLATPAAARADLAVDPPSCAADAPTISIASALFTARRIEEGLAWDARWVMDLDASAELRVGVIRFAAPLPAGETLRPARGVAAITEDGHIVGLCASRGAVEDPWSPATLAGRTVVASFVRPGALSTGQSAPIGAPVAAGSAVQIIQPALTSDARLDLTAGDLLERHVGYVAPRGVSRAAREEAQRLTEVKPGVTTSLVYLRGDEVHAAGLEGRVVGPRAHTRTSTIGVGVLFAGIVGALVLAARRLRLAATVERADALLASELDSIAMPGPTTDHHPSRAGLVSQRLASHDTKELR